MTWTDTLPAIPLAVGLPVIVHWTDDEREQVIIACDERGGQSIVRGDPMPNGYSVTGDNDCFRVDLADPQGLGFGYALRYAGQHCDPSISYLWPAMASRWMRGETTDTDRLALAQAIADVVETCDQCDRVVSGLTCKRYQCDVCRTEYQECEGSCPRGCEDEEGE